MATLYFNNAVNTDLDTVGNWWTNSGFSTPAGRVPTVGDAVILSGGVSAETGTLTCDSCEAHITIGVSFVDPTVPVFNCPVTLAENGMTIYSGTFNSTVKRTALFANIDCGTFNAEVGEPSALVGVSGGGPTVYFAATAYIAPTNMLLVTIAHRASFNGFSFVYSPSSPDVAGANDVRDGVFNLGIEGTLEVSTPDYPSESDVRLGVDYADEAMTGTLDLPAESDVRVGVDYDNANQTGSLVISSKAASLGSGEGFRS